MKELSIEISWWTWQKCLRLMEKAGSNEWSMLGNTTVVDNTIKVGHAIVPEQKNSGAETDMTEKGIAEAPFKLKDHPGDECSFWIHSHVNMGVTPSGTDYKTLKDLGSGGWIAGAIMNKKGELHGYVHMGKPFNALINNVPVTVAAPPIPKKTIEEWDKEFDDNVTVGWTWAKDRANQQTAWSQIYNTYGGGYGYGGYGYGKNEVGAEEKKEEEETKQDRSSLLIDKILEARALYKADIEVPKKNRMTKREKRLWAQAVGDQLDSLIELQVYREGLNKQEYSAAIANIDKGKEWYDGIEKAESIIA